MNPFKLSTAFLFILFLCSCEKENFIGHENTLDHNSLRFKSIALYDSIPLYNTIYNSFQDVNSTRYIESAINSKVGPLDWDNSLLFLNNNYDQGIVCVPIGKTNDTKTRGILFASYFPERQNKVDFNLVSRDDIQPILNGTSPLENRRMNLETEIYMFEAFDSYLFIDESREITNFLTDGGLTSIQNIPPPEDPCNCIIEGVTIENPIETEEEGEGEGTNPEGIVPTEPTEPTAPNSGNTGGNQSGGGGSRLGANYSGPYGHGNWGNGYHLTGTGTTSPSGGGSLPPLDPLPTLPPRPLGGGSGAPDLFPWDPTLEPPEVSSFTFDYYVIDCNDNGELDGPQVDWSWEAEIALDLIDEIGLSCEDLECLVKHPNILYEIDEILDNINFLCSTNSEAEIYSSVLNELCNLSEIRNSREEIIQGFIDKITENENIILTDGFKNCGPLECILNTLMINNDNLFCSTVDENFISNPLASLTFEVTEQLPQNENYWKEHPNTKATTISNLQTPQSGQNVTIYFRPDLCNDDKYPSLKHVRDILHEAIHAQMFSDCWPEGVDYLEYKLGFAHCAEVYYGAEVANLDPEAQHKVMADKFIEQIAKSIHEYLGGNGSWEDYEYLAWEGLKQYPDYSSEQWFLDHLAESKIRYESNYLPVYNPCPK